MANIPLPSIDALMAFESAARHQSFTRAAAELNLTQGAISRQIRLLEDRLGSSLFQRVRQRVILTDAFREHPKISINCGVRLSPFDFETDPLDAAIHYGSPIWAGAIVHHLMDEDLIPVCMPLFRNSRRIRRPDDFTRVPLLHLTT